MKLKHIVPPSNRLFLSSNLIIGAQISAQGQRVVTSNCDSNLEIHIDLMSITERKCIHVYTIFGGLQ